MTELSIFVDEIGVKQACAHIWLVYGSLSDWRKNCNRKRILKSEVVGEEPLTERENKLMKENAELREENYILRDVFRFFVFAIKYKGTVDIQGLIALTDDEQSNAVYINWACTSPENNVWRNGSKSFCD